MLVLLAVLVAVWFITGASAFKGVIGSFLTAIGILGTFAVAWEGNITGRIVRTLLGILSLLGAWISYELSPGNNLFWVCLGLGLGIGFLGWAVVKDRAVGTE